MGNRLIEVSEKKNRTSSLVPVPIYSVEYHWFVYRIIDVEFPSVDL